MVSYLLIFIFISEASIFEDNLQKMRDAKKYPELIKLQLKRAEIELSHEKVNCRFVVSLLTNVLKDAENRVDSFSFSSSKTMLIYSKQFDKCFVFNEEDHLFEEQFSFIKKNYLYQDFVKSFLEFYSSFKENSKILVTSKLACFFNASSEGLKLREKLLLDSEIILKKNKEIDQYLSQTLSLAKACGNNGIQN